jgi:hypothetical protein
VLDGAQAAEFLAAAGAARAAVLEQRQRRAVAGGLDRGFAVQHQQAAVQAAATGTACAAMAGSRVTSVPPGCPAARGQRMASSRSS